MNVDVLVVGAGPAGLSAALCFVRWCDSVVVVETSSRGNFRRAGEHIPPAGLSEVAAVGLGSLFADERHGSSPGVSSAWGADTVIDKEYFFSLQQSGINLRRDVFDEAMLQAAEDAGVTLIFSTRLARLHRDADGYRATLNGPGGPQQVEAWIVVDASGRRATASRKLGSVRKRFDRMVGLVARVKGDTMTDDGGRIRIESMEDGWWYGVQLQCGDHLLTYMTDADVLKKYPHGAKALWQERLKASRLIAPQADSQGSPQAVDIFDASSQYLPPPKDPHFLAIGDAAMAFDPISSWGITKALCDGYYGARAMEREFGGEEGAVANYATRRLDEFEKYMTKRTVVYEAECRWGRSEFWRSRQRAHEVRAI